MNLDLSYSLVGQPLVVRVVPVDITPIGLRRALGVELRSNAEAQRPTSMDPSPVALRYYDVFRHG